MSDDLISREALLKRIEAKKCESKSIAELFFFDGVMAIIDTQETAFDKEKVIEELEDYLFEKYCVEGDGKIAEIVEKGGLNE